jgi:hypothetical protein
VPLSIIFSEFIIDEKPISQEERTKIKNEKKGKGREKAEAWTA